jgi:transcriptional regulator with XRE-family HTH domain
MESNRFKEIRARLNKTQKKLAQLLGVSVKAIHSYEQGWRKIPHHVERQLLFLLSRVLINGEDPLAKCWDILKCPDKRREKCPASEFNSGDLCWFINGTMCSGKIYSSWEEKMDECKECKVFNQLFKNMNKKELNDKNG